MPRYLFLPRYLTRLQMIQFVCVFFHALLPLVFDCGYPKIVPLVCVILSCCSFNSSMCRRCVQMPSHSSSSLQTFTSLPTLRSNKSPRTELKQGRMYRLYLYSIRYIEAFQIISVQCNGRNIFNGIIATTLFSIKIKK